MRQLIPAVVVLMCCVLLGACSSTPSEPDTGGLDTEPGLRLRVYYIGEDFDPTLPLQPGQSPNVDMTVPGVWVDKDAVFNDAQAITDAKDEKIDNQYIAEWTGWIKIVDEGEYSFTTETLAPTQILIDETVPFGFNKANAMYLTEGWHTIRVLQRVNSLEHKPIRLLWGRRGYSVVNLPPFDSPSTDQLRAPKFYFRPTQSGKKELADGSARPGLGKKLAAVHPGYRVTNIRPGGMEMPVGGLGMLSDGRLVVARFDAQTLKAPAPTEEPNGDLWLITNPTSDDPAQITGEKIADNLYEPSGVKVIDDAIYVSQRSELSKFVYNVGTKKWDKEIIATGWQTNDFHQISAGLPWIAGPSAEHPGYFYMSRGAGLGKGQNPPNHASVWLIDLSKPAGENVTPLTGGHRTPNGLGLNKAGDCFVIDNQGGWTPANEINHVQAGRFYGYYLNHKPPSAYRSPFQPDVRDGTTGVTEAAIKLPQDEIGNSPTELLLFPDGHRFDGQMAVADMRYGGLNRVFLEKVNGVYQGCAMRFTQGLEAGPNRIFFGPDGSLYVGGIGGRHASTWYWVDPQTEQPTYQGLERMTPTGEEVFEIDHMRAVPGGFVLSFTQPVAKEVLENPDMYKVKQWTYINTGKYGGPKIDPQDLQVTVAGASPDGKSVALKIPGLKQGYVVHVQTDPVSSQGKAIWSGDVWYTLNEIPE